MIEDFARPEWADFHDKLANELMRVLAWVATQLRRPWRRSTKQRRTAKNPSQAVERQRP